MDRQQIELFTALGSSLIFLLGVGVGWLLLPWLSREQLLVAFALLFMLILLVCFRLSIFFQHYVIAPKALADELTLMVTVNPNHRVKVSGPKNMRHLAETINLLAERIQNLLDTQTSQIERAKANLEDEKDRLATLMSELTAGVLMCTNEGRILLYNHRAKRLLEQADLPTTATDPPLVGSFVGLGRSIFGLIDRNVITHALEDLAYHHESQSDRRFAQFVTATTNGQLIKARVAPILTSNSLDSLNGFILTLEDVTQQSRRSIRRDTLLRTLTEGVRASLANIRTAIETIEQYPEMDSVKLKQLRQVIHEESLTLSGKLNQTSREYEADFKADWQFEEMLISDLLWAIQQRFENKLEVTTTIHPSEINPWLRVDSYALVRVMAFVMQRLKADFGILDSSLRIKQTGQLIALDLVWAGQSADLEAVWRWQNEAINIAGTNTLTLIEIVERHGGEVWCQTDKRHQQLYLRLLLPMSQPKTGQLPLKMNKPSPKVDAVSRPEYYDFDLFSQSTYPSELENHGLSALVYTVFDTETTGLNPMVDEIISASAVRIVNSRLLRQELFDQLIDPQRAVSEESIAVHGILPEMLQGQPTINQVLPNFYRFAEGTVLVAHNAAFDMRMLQLKEGQTGIKFTNPLLDTLLLSAVVHPHQKDHSLEAMAERLGINVIGRHTSLGDAIVTGEVFLKLLPLLAEKGITTLAEAWEATEKSYYARLNY